MIITLLLCRVSNSCMYIILKSITTVPCRMGYHVHNSAVLFIGETLQVIVSNI